MQKVDENQLADILSEATIISTENHAGMLIHNISHPTLGNATTIQGSDGGLLIPN
jgi:hypothetical protein